MRMPNYLLACFVAGATFFATCETGDALTLDKSSSENARMLNILNLTSEKDGEDDSNAELDSSSPFDSQDSENIEEQSYPASTEVQDPKNTQPITKHFVKRCTDPITKRNFKCPFFKNFRKKSTFPTSKSFLREDRFNENLDYQIPYPKKLSRSDGRTSLKHLFKTKFTRKTDDYKQKTAEDNISAHRKPYVNEDEVNVVAGRDIVKGRGKRQFICRCHKDNCKGKHCDPSRSYFIDPEILNSDSEHKHENIYQLGPIFDPVYYIQNIQRQQRLLAKSSLGTSPNQIENSEGFNPNSPLYFPHNPVTPHSNIVLPIVYLNTPYNNNPITKDYPYDIVGSAKAKENNKISINDCIRLYGRGFCAFSASTQHDFSEEKTDSFEDEEPVLGAETPEYEQSVEHDYSEENYDEMTEPSLHKPLEPLEPDDDSLGTFHEDDNEDYYHLKSEAHNSDEVVQYKPKESIGKATAISQNSRYRTSSHEGATVSENIVKTPINDGSEEILGSVNVGQKFPSAINIELEEKTIDSAPKEILADIPSALGKVCTIETKNSLEVTKDKTCLTENRQYTFSNNEKSSAEEHISEEKQKEVVTSSEDKENEFKDDIVAAANIDTIEKPTLKISESDSNKALPNKPVAEVMYENLPSVAVTERVCESEELGIKTTNLGEKSNNSCLEAVKAQNSEEEIVAMKPPDETINSELEPAKPSSDLSLEVGSPEVISFESDQYRVVSNSEEMIAKTAITSSKMENSEEEIVAMEPPDKIISSEIEPVGEVSSEAQKYETGAAKSVKTSSRSRPMPAKPSSESSFEVDNPDVISSESEQYQIDSNSKEMIAETAITSSKEENSNEEIVAMEPPDKIISSEIEPLGEVSSEARKYETGAAKSVETSSKSRPMPAKPSSESSFEVDNPDVISSESEQYQFDSNSEEMAIKTPIKYYSPEDRLLEYKKKHQNEYYSSVEQSENTASYDSVQEETLVDVDSDIPESKQTSKTPLITQPKEFQTDEEDEIIDGMAEGSGMLEEETENERPLEKAKHFEDYEASGDVNEDEYVGTPIKSNENPYVTETTVAENENIDDQYTGAAFTEDSGKSIQGDDEKYAITNSELEINKESFTESSRNKSDYEGNLYSVTDRTSDVETSDQNNNEDIPLVLKKADVETSGPNNNDNNQLVGSSENLYSITDRTADMKTTDQNNNDVNKLDESSINKMYEEKLYTVTERTSEVRTSDTGSSIKLYPATDTTPDVPKPDKSNNKDNQSIESSGKEIYEESSKTSEHDYSEHQNLVGKTRNDESGSLSKEIYYVPTSSELEDSPDDSVYLGKILPQQGNNPSNSGNSDLLYIGDGVRLPLKTIRLDDGSYSLAFSNRRCEPSMKTNYPCYIQRNQRGVKNSANDKKRSMEDDDEEERDFKEYYFRKGSKKAVRGKKNASVDDSRRRISKDSSKPSRYRRRDEKKEEEQYNNYVENLFDVNDIPAKDRAGIVINALDRVVNDEGIFSTKDKFKDKKYEITQRDSTVEKLQNEDNKENDENLTHIGYDTSKRVEVLKVILNWVKNFILTSAKRISNNSL